MTTRFTLKSLPYPTDALEPVISARNVLIHRDKYQAHGIAKLNELVKNSAYVCDSLESLMVHTRSAMRERVIFNDATQLWNHEFFWDSLSPSPDTEPPAHIAEALRRAFGSVEFFRAEAVNSGLGCFGSGWVWLAVSPSGRWNVLSTHDADNPMLWGEHPLWVCDLWEHAYYLD